MKAAVILCALVVVISARPDDKYTEKWDDTDYMAVVQNPRLFQAYVDCVLDLGKCTPDGKELRTRIGDALETRCSKCTEKQQKATRYIIKFIINNKPDIWKKLCEKYDPTGKYSAEYEKELKTLNQDRR